jgi:hypothetical protein
MTQDDLLLTLEELVPSFENVPGDWQDALGRARQPIRARARRRLLLVAVVAFGVGVLATTSLGQDVVNGALDRLGAWVGSAPGEPASPEQQAAFDKANAESYAHFAAGTKVGRLLSTTFEGEKYELLGFRDGASLCLRLLAPSTSSRPWPAACVPQRELVDLGRPAAVVTAGDAFTRGSEGVVTAVYGVAADAVERVQIETASGERHDAQLEDNAFLYLAAGNQSHAESSGGAAPVRAIAETRSGMPATVQIDTGIHPRTTSPADLPGPSVVERPLASSHVTWLEHGEPRGDPYTWTGAAFRTLRTSRVVQPDPSSSFKMAIAYGTTTDGFARYCFVWLWPLVKGTGGYGCMLAEVTGALPMFGDGVGADQFPLMSGLAADDVASLELFFRNGAHENVPLTDNVYAFQVPRAVPTKLVAYDVNHQVVGIYMP